MFGSSLPPGVCRRARVSFYDNGYVPLVVSTFRFFPHSRLVSNIGTSSIIFSFFRIIILETIFITNNTIVHIVLLKKFASSFLLKITYFPLHQKHLLFCTWCVCLPPFSSTFRHKKNFDRAFLK